MAKVRYLLWMLFVLVSAPLLAQEPSQPVRLELPFNIDETYVEVMALPDSSLLLYHKISNIWGTEATFHLTRYDPKLEEVWTGTVKLEPDQYFIRSFTEAPYTYLVFGSKDPRQYTIARVNLVTGQSIARDYELEMLEAIYEFSVLQGRFFLIGENKDDGKPMLLYLNPVSGEVKPLPAVYGDESTFSDLLADPAHGRVDVVISESNGRVSRLQIKSFNVRGELINNRFILPQNSYSLLKAEVTPGDTTTKLLIGTYGTRDVRYTQGFFTIPAISDTDPAKFYTILQLKNFLKYMKPRREERTRRREAARLRAGKEPGYRYRLLLHDLITTPTGYVLTAEVYYPQFRENSNVGLNRTVILSRGPEGYKHTQVVTLGFDKNGVLLWDNSFPIEDIYTSTLTNTVEVGYDGADGQVIMAYPDEDNIVYRVMQEDKYTDEDTELKLQTYSKDEKIIDTDEQGIIYWYGSNFAAFGFQRVNGPEGIRSVFYINKISF
ncbi:hypothetical protein I2I11_08890 [Pontibacter sp. 172403-2]|uniref:hypothetical protein n=1 Tax=Pontibacter rufus TaxID=2791028 RepID=UPI0018AFF08D|nr:hypothetical protein [Pontibacter sp. 172403-2]MBF9253406.1 hypothetical protein [Pontibacter sp. 172403-2]